MVFPKTEKAMVNHNENICHILSEEALWFFLQMDFFSKQPSNFKQKVHFLWIDQHQVEITPISLSLSY